MSQEKLIEPYQDTKALAWLRGLLETQPELRRVVGDIARFRIVIDANAVLSDLGQKVKFPERKATALEELIAADVFEVVAPRWLSYEMKSAVPQYCRRQGLNEDAVWSEWEAYSENLVWDETLYEPVDFNAVDPKDTPYVVASVVNNAIGVLSNDKHIDKMGGRRLTLDFVLQCRSYARATVVSVGITVNGAVLGALSLALLVKVLKTAGVGLSKLPNAIKLGALVVVLAVLIFPDSRQWLIARIQAFSSAAGPATSDFLTYLSNIAEIAVSKQEEATAALVGINAVIDNE